MLSLLCCLEARARQPAKIAVQNFEERVPAAGTAPAVDEVDGTWYALIRSVLDHSQHRSRGLTPVEMYLGQPAPRWIARSIQPHGRGRGICRGKGTTGGAWLELFVIGAVWGILHLGSDE